MKADVRQAAAPKAREDDWKKFALMAAGMAVTLAAAFGFGLLLETPPTGLLRFEWSGLIAGAAATAPLVFLLEWFMRTGHPPLARFRESQIGFFAGIGFKFTPMRIAVLALGAGITEELLFRGVFQTWAAGQMPAFLAVLLPNVLFGALHWRTTLYALIAGLVGVYLGVLFLVTGNLLAPIVAHALYDAVALHKTARAIDARGPQP